MPRWRQSEAFTPLERDVLEYAEVRNPRKLTQLDEPVELARS